MLLYKNLVTKDFKKVHTFYYEYVTIMLQEMNGVSFMKKLGKFFVAVISLILVLSMLAGCSSGNKTVSTKKGKAGHFIIATDKDFSPFEFKDESGNTVGFDMDILEAIAKDQGFTYELKVVGWDAAVDALQKKSKSIDGMIAGASITEERKGAGWIYSNGYFTATQTVFVKEGSEITNFEGLKEKVVGVVGSDDGTEKTLGYKYAEEVKEEYQFEIKTYETYAKLYKAVEKGEVEAGFGDTPSVAYEITNNSSKLKILKETENTGLEYGFVISKPEFQNLIDLFNAGLENIKKNGTYDKIKAKYFGEQETEPETTAAPSETEKEGEEGKGEEEN